MNIIDCLDKDVNDGTFQESNSYKSYLIKKLEGNSLEEFQLLISIAGLLYKTKSVRKTIEMIESLTNASYCVRHEVNPELDSIVWNNSELKDTEIINKKISEPYTGC